MFIPLYLEVEYYRVTFLTFIIIGFTCLVHWSLDDSGEEYAAEVTEYCDYSLDLTQEILKIDHPKIRTANRELITARKTDKEKCETFLIFAMAFPFQFDNLLEEVLEDEPEETKLNIEELLEDFEDIVGEPAIKSYGYHPDSWNPIKMITSGFLHGGWQHLIFNMFYLFLFGRAIEAAFGFLPFLFGIALTSIGASLTYNFFILFGVLNPLPSVGASGYIFGLMGMFLYALPHVRVRMFYWFLFRGGNFTLPAWTLIIFYFFQEVFNLVGVSYSGVNVPAHIGGFVSGYLYAKVLGKKFDVN